MKTGLPLYEGDSLIRQGGSFPLDKLDTIELEARKLRSVTVWKLLEQFADWIEEKAWRARQRDVAQYLARATDQADLERRMKALDHGLHAIRG